MRPKKQLKTFRINRKLAEPIEYLADKMELAQVDIVEMALEHYFDYLRWCEEQDANDANVTA